ERAREGSQAVHGSVGRGAAGEPGRNVAADPGAGVHDLRTEARLRDRLPPVPAVFDHRPRGRLGADVDGHDDAAAGGGIAAVQADLLRAGRRLVAGGGQPGAELWGIGIRPGSRWVLNLSLLRYGSP